MRGIYSLLTPDDEIRLGEIEFLHTSEEPAVLDIENLFRRYPNPKLEESIWDAYTSRVQWVTHGGSSTELIRQLLTNDCSISVRSGATETLLQKNFFWIRYDLVLDAKVIELGDYYKTSISGADEQLTRFCRWTDGLSSIPGATAWLISQSIEAGYSIRATSDCGSEWLLRVNCGCEIIESQPATLDFILAAVRAA